MKAAQATGETSSLKALPPLRWSNMRSIPRPFSLIDLIIHSLFDIRFVIRNGKEFEALGCAATFIGVRLLEDPVVQTLSVSASGQAETKRGCFNSEDLPRNLNGVKLHSHSCDIFSEPPIGESRSPANQRLSPSLRTQTLDSLSTLCRSCNPQLFFHMPS